MDMTLVFAASSTLTPSSPCIEEPASISTAPASSSFVTGMSGARRPGYPSSQISSLSTSSPVQMKPSSGGGYYPASLIWWNKGDHPNIHDINSSQQFHDALAKSGNKLVLVDFYASGCRSCKAIHPKICQIAADNPDINILKVNFYDNRELCRSLNVTILPFFHIYRGPEGRLDAFSCSLTKINKMRDAIAKYKCSLLNTQYTDHSALLASTLTGAGCS